MKQIIKLDHDDIRAILAEKFNAPRSSVVIELDTIHHEVSAKIHISEKVESSDEAYWEVWAGWVGNHDRRIDGATCSNCGFKHPTVYEREALSQLYKTCPQCGKKMGYKEV